MRPFLLLAGLAFATVARADCYDDVYYSSDCYYEWDSTCDDAIEACDRANYHSSTPLTAEQQLIARFEASRSTAWREDARYYYLTKTTSQYTHADSACAPGFHWAHVQELVNGSDLVYDLSQARSRRTCRGVRRRAATSRTCFRIGSMRTVGWPTGTYGPATTRRGHSTSTA